MTIAEGAIARPVLTWMLMLGCLLGGLWGLATLARLEDPNFTIKTALVFVPYPGATAEEVERQVAEPMESAIQQLTQLKEVTSVSMPGMAEITVEIEDTYGPDDIPQVWDELRSRVRDAQASLPSGAREPIVNDTFGDVFGLYYAVTAPAFDNAELREIARFLRRELLTVDGVVKVELAGVPQEAIYVEPPSDRLYRLGVPPDEALALFTTEEQVPGSGTLRVDDRSVRVGPGKGFDSLAAIERLRIGRPGGTEQLSIVDIARVSRREKDIPDHVVRHNGQRAFTVAVAGNPDLNIVEIGNRVDAHLAALAPEIPLGVALRPIYEQHVVVDEAVRAFIVNLAASVAIVIGVLCVAMGWRVGLVVGATLLLTVLGTVFFMKVFGIAMERISLGALIIAMGMLVDNAIVIAEGMVTGMRRGQDATRAAGESARRTQVPLLGATVIGIMAFSGIGLSPDSTGEFLFSLFAVIGISLLLSWVLAITVTPLLGTYLLKANTSGVEEDPYASPLYRLYAGALRAVLRVRWLVVLALVALTGTSLWGFGLVSQQFFPNSSTPLFYVNVLLPQGTDIRATARDMAEMEAFLLEKEGVTAVTTLIGRGASRFMLTYSPEQDDPSYGQFVVRTDSLDAIDGLTRQVRETLRPRFPQAEICTERLVFGPPSGASIEARFMGRDAAVLRLLGEQAERLFRDSGVLRDIRTDWRSREVALVPVLDDERARVAGVTRVDLAQAMQFGTSGVDAGNFREGDTSIPIIMRAPEIERQSLTTLEDRLVWSEADQGYVPVQQIVSGFETRAEEALIHRRDRLRTLTVQAAEIPGLTADDAFRQVRPLVEAMALPPGYRLEWGGEYEASSEAQASLGARLPISFLVMLVISILLFSALRQPLILWLVVPMAVTGVVAGLLLTGLPFTFTALLGMLSLSGMLMKNAIVLVDETDAQIRDGVDRPHAVVEASVSRLRPVTLAAGTTILGMIPLLSDAFFASMAVTIMAGLAFASFLTMFAVPVFYSLLFGIRQPPGPETLAGD